MFDSGGQTVWAALLGMSTGEAWLRRDEPRSAELIAQYERAIAQLDRGVPFAYAVGSAGFRTLELRMDARALIPRPETEGLVDLVLERCTTGLVADIGTGSGCIALSLAVEGKFDKVVAVEASAAAVQLARENVKRIAPPTPVEIREGNLLEPLVDKGELFRAIVSNPPYLTETEFAQLEPAVRGFEPRTALVSGADGLDATRALFAGAGAVLEPPPGGLLAIEIDERRAAAVRAIGKEHGWVVTIHDDLFGRHRYALATKEEQC